MSSMFDNKELAKEIAKDYIKNYLSRLKKDEVWTKENIEFLGAFAESSKEDAFWLLYNNLDKAKKVMVNNPLYVPSLCRVCYNT